MIAERFERVPGEASGSEITERAVSPAPPLVDPDGAFALRFQAVEELVDQLRIDRVTPQVVADERVAAVLGRQAPRPRFCEPSVRLQAAVDEVVERATALVVCDAGAPQALLELPARPVAVVERTERELPRFRHGSYVDSTGSASASAGFPLPSTAGRSRADTT
jgi:hypothetical protein